MSLSCSNAFRRLARIVLASAVFLCACSHTQHTSSPPPSQSPTISGQTPAQATTPSQSLNLKELFPHVRADLNAKVVEFDAIVSPMLIPDPKAPLFFLEVICCSPNTREHETLLVSSAKPSHIHAALLAIGLIPGHPGFFERTPNQIIPHPPVGPRLQIQLSYTSAQGQIITCDPRSWIVSSKDSRPLDAGDFLFAGSRLIDRPGGPQQFYDADGTGQIIGLHTFSSELIAFSAPLNPDARTLEPEWIADLSVIPPAKTPVRVHIQALPATMP